MILDTPQEMNNPEFPVTTGQPYLYGAPESVSDTGYGRNNVNRRVNMAIQSGKPVYRFPGLVMPA